MQVNGRIAETLLNFLDRGVELAFCIRRRKISDALRIDKDHVLFAADQQPHDEVRMKVSGLEEADAATFTEVAQEVQLLALEEGLRAVVIRLQIFDEVALALVERHGADLDELVVEVEQ